MGNDMMNTLQTHIIATLVENEPGVLYEVANMFRRRGFNIDSISVGLVETEGLARMTIVVKGDDRTVEQVVKQLNKLVSVIKVSTLSPDNVVTRELALIKIHIADTKARSDVIQYVNIFRGHIIDVASESLIVEITGDSEKIDAFVDLARPFGVKELARTGMAALTRGGRAIRE
jgi:acetolactate synthase-1/3 small subunit